MEKQFLSVSLYLIDAHANAFELDKLTSTLMKFLREFDVTRIKRLEKKTLSKRAKGNAETLAALALVVTPTVLPQIIDFIQNWLIGRRKIIVQAPDGTRIEFTSKKRYSEEDILALVEKLGAISKGGHTKDNAHEIQK